jgi:hypothetical protein
MVMSRHDESGRCIGFHKRMTKGMVMRHNEQKTSRSNRISKYEAAVI